MSCALKAAENGRLKREFETIFVHVVHNFARVEITWCKHALNITNNDLILGYIARLNLFGRQKLKEQSKKNESFKQRLPELNSKYILVKRK